MGETGVGIQTKDQVTERTKGRKDSEERSMGVWMWCGCVKGVGTQGIDEGKMRIGSPLGGKWCK